MLMVAGCFWWGLRVLVTRTKQLMKGRNLRLQYSSKGVLIQAMSRQHLINMFFNFQI